MSPVMPPPGVPSRPKISAGREPSCPAGTGGRKLPGVARSLRKFPVLAPVALAVAAVVTLSGCAQMDADLGQQWAQVTFDQNATFQTIEHVTDACSHVPNAKPYPLP